MFYKSVRHAIQGIRQAVQTERNFRSMLIIFVLVTSAGWIFSITALEWLAVLICCGGVLAIELVNSAIERLVDLTTKQPHPLAKEAKDMAAAASLVWSVFCAAVGVIIFAPHLASIISRLIGGVY